MRISEYGVRLVDRECRRAGEHRAPRAAPAQGEIKEQLIASISHEHVFAVVSPCLADELAQRIGERIGVAIEINLRDRGFDLVLHFMGKWTRILVR